MDSSEKEPQKQQSTSQSCSPVTYNTSETTHATLRDLDNQQPDSVTKTMQDSNLLTQLKPIDENARKNAHISEEEIKALETDDNKEKNGLQLTKSIENHHPQVINEGEHRSGKQGTQDQNQIKRETHQSSSDVSSTSQEDNDISDSSSDKSKEKAKPNKVNQQSQVIESDDHTQQLQQVEEKKQDEAVKHENQDQEEEEEDEDEEDAGVQQSNFSVIEISPKGRFERFDEELGRGAYKIVYKGVDNETGREIAWNVINLNRLPKQDRIRIRSEIDLIKKLDHQNIIHFIWAWQNKEKEQVIFITEMISGGSLRKYVKRIKTPRLKVIKGWCKQILKGLVYLHQQKPYPVIHRDLKCDNIFINSNSGEIRIGDLGLSTPMQSSYTTSVLGTPEFMAPEVYEEQYGTGVDIYAFGMCVLEMITLDRPYKECSNPAQIYNKVIKGIPPLALERIIDVEVKNFILQCLNKEEKRPSAQELLDSQFLNDLDSEKNNLEVQITKAIVQVGWKKNELNEAQQKAIKKMQKMNKSTIMEEEEENSAGSTALHQEIKQMKAQGAITSEVLNNVTENNTNHGQEVANKNSDAKSIQVTVQNQDPIANNDLKANQQAIEQQSTQQLQQDSLQVDIDSQDKLAVVQKVSSKKQDDSKLKKRDQRLDESVIYLKKIDEEKQKKMQEKTIIANSQANEDNSDDNDNVPANENILDDLKKEDEQEEQRIAASLAGKQMSVEQIQTKDWTLLLENQQKQDLNKKNFKEDDPQQYVAVVLPQQQVPSAQKQTQQQAQQLKRVNTSELSKGSTTTFDDEPKRYNSNLISSLILQQQAAQQLHNSQSQIQNSSQSDNILKKAHNSLHQQSDNFLLHNPLNTQFNEKIQMNSDPQTSNDLFDNQSSSSNSSGDIGGHDSEVDKIVLTKLQPQPQELLLQQKSQDSVKLNPSQNTAQQQQKVSAQVNNQQNNKNEKTSAPVAETKTGAANINMNTNGKAAAQSTLSQQKSESQIGNPPKQQNTENLSLLKSQQIINNHQQVQQITASASTTNQLNPMQPIQKANSTQASQQSGSKQISKPESKRAPQNKMVKMEVNIAGKDVTFDFDISSDTPEGVAKEMVQEFRLHESQVEVISKEIKNYILKNSQKSNLLPTNSSEQQKQPPSSQVQHQQQKSQLSQQILQNPQSSQQNTNKSSQKPFTTTSMLSKEVAMTMFDKLLADIEYFYSNMKSLGIETTDQIVEVMDCSTEEKNTRMSFFNKVLMAKQDYKRSIEQIRQQKLKQKPQLNEGGEIRQQKGLNSTLTTGEEIKVGSLAPQLVSSTQKILYIVPKYIRLIFKQCPYQFQCIPKLTKPLKKRDPAEDALHNIDPSSAEEEVTQLQNLLNLLWFDSIIILSEKAPTKEEGQQIINSHIPLKVDGYFGEKTEKCVIKFQKYKGLTKNGVVTDHIWHLMINHADQIIVVARKQLSPFDLQKELQKQQIQIQSLNSKDKLSIPSQNQIASQSSSNNLIKLAAKEKCFNTVKPPPPTIIAAAEPQRISNPNEQPYHPVYIQSGLNVSSPTKTQVSRQEHIIDYKSMIEQNFIPQQKNNPKDEADHNEEAHQDDEETHDDQNNNNY